MKGLKETLVERFAGEIRNTDEGDRYEEQVRAKRKQPAWMKLPEPPLRERMSDDACERLAEERINAMTNCELLDVINDMLRLRT